jgi:hypothetical protein
MAIGFDHHIVPSTDKHRTARFWTETFGLPEARVEGPFLAVDLANDVALYVAGWNTTTTPQHYAFLVDEDTLDAVLGRLQASGADWWADPDGAQPRQVTNGGRGFPPSATPTGTCWSSSP